MKTPSLGELFTAPKTLPADRPGPGGRPWILVDGELRRTGPGDASRLICPMCSNDQLAVAVIANPARRLMPGVIPIGASHKCPGCRFTVDILATGMESLLNVPTF